MMVQVQTISKLLFLTLLSNGNIFLVVSYFTEQI